MINLGAGWSFVWRTQCIRIRKEFGPVEKWIELSIAFDTVERIANLTGEELLRRGFALKKLSEY